jgi:hypothetical protein
MAARLSALRACRTLPPGFFNFLKIPGTHFWGFMKYASEMASCGKIYTPSFIKMGQGVQAVLRSSLRNLRGCNVSITDLGDLRSTPLRWCHVVRYILQVS